MVTPSYPYFITSLWYPSLVDFDYHRLPHLFQNLVIYSHSLEWNI